MLQTLISGLETHVFCFKNEFVRKGERHSTERRRGRESITTTGESSHQVKMAYNRVWHVNNGNIGYHLCVVSSDK